MRSVLPLTLAGLLLLAGCAAPLQTAPAGSTADVADSTASDTVVATGAGSVTADPNLAVVTVAVRSSADAADAARERTATRVADLRDALADAGVDDENVTTASFSLTPEYDHSKGDREVVGYRAVHVLRIETAPADAGRVVDASVAAAAAEVYGVQFTLTDERREELRADAIADAVDAARSDAEAAASAADRSLGEVDSMQVGSAPVAYPYAADRAVAEGGAGSTEFQPGPVTVSATVTVSYRLS